MPPKKGRARGDHIRCAVDIFEDRAVSAWIFTWVEFGAPGREASKATRVVLTLLGYPSAGSRRMPISPPIFATLPTCQFQTFPPNRSGCGSSGVYPVYAILRPSLKVIWPAAALLPHHPH